MSEAILDIPANTSGTIFRVSAPAQDKPAPTHNRDLRLKRRLRLAPGQIIPGTRWRIIRWLGEGSMGVVYEARHVEIERRAAIKIVAILPEDQDAIDAFRSEASASAKIGSPNIVDVFDFEVLNDGRLLMAMEFVPGRSLHDIKSTQGRMAPGRLIGLFRQVCKGLQAAHDAGLVHRDIKPDNIMIGDVAGRRDTVKIVDFGIATILGERSERHAGTPFYMAPEGLQSKTAIDGRYDIYSVGCVMYEMLAGKPPFVARSLERVLQMHMYEPVPEIVTEDETVPAKLIEVVYRCLAKEPADRFESMNELEAALCEAQIEGKLETTWDDLPLPPIDEDRRERLAARMPVRVVKGGVSSWWVASMLALGVAIGTAIALPRLRSEPTVEAIVTAEDSVVERLIDAVHQAAATAHYVYPPVDEPQAETAYKLLLQLEELNTDEALAAGQSLRAELASTLVRLGDEIWDKPGGEQFALDFYVQALMFDPEIEPARTRAALSPGELLALRRKAGSGDFSESELIAVEPLQALSANNPVEKQAKLQRIKTRRSGKRHATAAANLDQLMAEYAPPPPAAAPSVATPKQSNMASKIVSKADAARRSAKLKDAERLYHKALRIDEHRVDALSGLGRVYFEQGKYAKAVVYYNMAVGRSGRDAELRISLGDAYLKTLDYELALDQYKKAKQLGSRKADDRIARIARLTDD
jgi:tetratricopeptide (TPR) repeat protein